MLKLSLPTSGLCFSMGWNNLSLLSFFLQNPPPMNGFVQNANNMFTGFGRRVMSAFRPEVVSSLTSLAQEFALFDR